MKGIRSTCLCAVAAGMLALLGCQTNKEAEKQPKKEAATTPETSKGGSVAKLDDNHEVAEPLNFKNLTVWALLAKKIAELGDFLSLKEAQARGVAVVREMGAADHSLNQNQVEAQASEEGRSNAPQTRASGQPATVNALVIENEGDLPILVCAGTVVKGGNQDRQIGQDFVIAPKTSVPVEAFCIEAHRWTASRDGNQTFGLFQCKIGRAHV